MNVTQAEFQIMKEEIVKDMIARLMEERGLTMQQAFDAVYTSRLFEKLATGSNFLYSAKPIFKYASLYFEVTNLVFFRISL